jgi:superoxide dismutase
MVRDRLRLIEQKINAHKTLTDEEKVDLQQYVTGIYGSLTTFNVLFKEAHHQFRGSGKAE